MRVALETTTIAHGLPRPQNIDAARTCERAVAATGAVPVSIGIIAGQPRIGLSDEELLALATRDDVTKVSLHNAGVTMARGGWGATTVSATMLYAWRSGIRVVSCGGIGGVHRNAMATFDLSSDLTALASTPLVVVCSGAKSVLDLGKTVETLETLGVPVLGYGTDEFPAFYARRSGFRLGVRVSSAAEVANIAAAHWSTGMKSAVLVTVPCPFDFAIDERELAEVVASAQEAAAQSGLAGPELTPFLLKRIARSTGGRSILANFALLEKNARIAGEIAVELARSEAAPYPALEPTSA
jgi:pseudouridine-5'-phosphate glycosidase